MDDKTKQQASATPVPAWGRPFAIATAVVFFISLVFPVVAGLSKNTASFPLLWGRLDVGIAFLLAIMSFVILGLAYRRMNEEIERITYRLYRTLIHGILLMLVVFLLWGDRIIWVNGLPGIAWRAWLLLYMLPEWFCIMRASPDDSNPNHLQR